MILNKTLPNCSFILNQLCVYHLFFWANLLISWEVVIVRDNSPTIYHSHYLKNSLNPIWWWAHDIWCNLNNFLIISLWVALFQIKLEEVQILYFRMIQYVISLILWIAPKSFVDEQGDHQENNQHNLRWIYYNTNFLLGLASWVNTNIFDSLEIVVWILTVDEIH